MTALPPEQDHDVRMARPTPAGQEAGRGGYSMETWLELKSRLRARVAQREQLKSVRRQSLHSLLRQSWQWLEDVIQKATARAHPAWQRFKADAKWNARLAWRFYRPKLRILFHYGAGRFGYVLGYVYGWCFWYGRKWRQDPGLRHKGYVLAGSFSAAFIGIYLLMAVWGWLASSPEGELTVPGMLLADIAVIDTRDPTTMGQSPATAPQMAEPAAPAGFRFERYAGRTAQGQLVLDGAAAQAALRQILPVGTKATDALAFIARLYPSNGRETLEVVKQHCLGLPSSKVFRQRTITCTYVHDMPEGRQAFWIVAFTSDRQARVTELSATARLVK